MSSAANLLHRRSPPSTHINHRIISPKQVKLAQGLPPTPTTTATTLSHLTDTDVHLFSTPSKNAPQMDSTKIVCCKCDQF
eukprot:scaffold3416_cov237-Alexandrium_tamarense.AAC.3